MRRMLKSILLLIGIVHSELSLEIIKKVNKDDNCLSENLKYTYFNPLFAHLLIRSDYIANNRFYNSFIKPAYDNKSADRNYGGDEGTDSFTKSLILLFPSPTGTLKTHRNTKDNFAKNYFTLGINNNTEERLLENIKSLINIVVRLYRKETINLKLINLKEATEREIGRAILTVREKGNEKLDKIIRSLELEEEVKKEIQKAILTAGGKR